MRSKLQEGFIKLIDHVLVNSSDYGFDKKKKDNEAENLREKYCSSTKFIKVEN